MGGAATTVYRNAFLTYNPAARGLDGRRMTDISRAVDILRHAGHGVETVPTEGPDSAAALVAACIRGGADLILVAGGDGTINEAVNGMIHEQVPLGIHPQTQRCIVWTKSRAAYYSVGRVLRFSGEKIGAAASLCATGFTF